MALVKAFFRRDSRKSLFARFSQDMGTGLVDAKDLLGDCYDSSDSDVRIERTRLVLLPSLYLLHASSIRNDEWMFDMVAGLLRGMVKRGGAQTVNFVSSAAEPLRRDEWWTKDHSSAINSFFPSNSHNAWVRRGALKLDHLTRSLWLAAKGDTGSNGALLASAWVFSQAYKFAGLPAGILFFCEMMFLFRAGGYSRLEYECLMDLYRSASRGSRYESLYPAFEAANNQPPAWSAPELTREERLYRGGLAFAAVLLKVPARDRRRPWMKLFA
eukprot:jgi/Mesvir1/24121/Mv10838-RA.1